MQRRSFLKKAGLGLAAGAAAAPAIVKADSPAVTWRMVGSWPKALDTLFGAQEIISKRVAEATGGKFNIKVYAAGEIVSGFQVLDAVQNGTVECGHTATYYYFGKDPTFALNCSAPFGMNARGQNAWMYYGGGNELVNEFFKGYNVMQFPAGNTGCQMGGWFRKEIKTVHDLKGLKFRVGGFAGTVLAKLGVVPQMIPGGDVYPALEKGTIDAAEWVGPYDDEKLGFYKVAKYYYYPGWWEAGTQAQLLVNLKAFAALPKEYQAILESACAEANVLTMAKYDAVNPDALKRLVAKGVKLRPFSNAIMAASYKAAMEVYAETSAKNPAFKKIYDAIVKFQADQVQWWSIAEDRMNNFMSAAERLSQQEARKKG
jgi:TRAP-type mannitol/chloroaromatic compound transport system substrate-binding protein